MTRVGVVDVGTNSVRHLVADVSPEGSLEEVERSLTITRLGEGVDGARALAPEPIGRTVDAVAAAVRTCRAREASVVRIIATSAVRDAANRETFLDAVVAACGIRPDVLSGEQEARLGFEGATRALTVPPPFLVVDIGGGSTELVRGAGRAERWISLDVGSVRMTERHIRSDPPTPQELDAVRRDVGGDLARAAAALGEAPATLIGLAGTITTLAAVALGLSRYDRARIHGARLGRAEIAAIRQRLAAMTSEERRALPVMPRGREDVIVAGILVLEAIMQRFDRPDCLVSESDILDGAALDAATAASR